MGAYNWLHTSTECYRCKNQHSYVLQVHIGWCRYEDYTLGDMIVWMSPKDRENFLQGDELRTFVEVGSETWRTFSISAGDDFECLECGAKGSVLVNVVDNRFSSTLFTPECIPYSTII